MTTRSETDRGPAYTPGAEPPPPVAEKASLVEDFIDIFYAPSTVFARRETSSFWPYLASISLIAAGLQFASRSISSAVFDAEFSRNMAKAAAKNPQLTEEIIAKQRGVMEGISSFGIYFATPLMIFLAAVLIWVGAKAVGARFSFDRAMLVGAIAQIPRLLGALFTTVQGLLMDDTSSITSMHSVGYSPARFIDPDSVPSQILNLIGRFDIFTLWVTFLLGVGVAVIGRVPRTKGMAAGAIAWGIASFFTVVSLLWS